MTSYGHENSIRAEQRLPGNVSSHPDLRWSGIRDLKSTVFLTGDSDVDNTCTRLGQILISRDLNTVSNISPWYVSLRFSV